ncbi:response regulator transcription factor [Achromobacter veterisilvae]|jgi:DNA-binding NarL/FixJ family response regulator|uniref:Response regulator UvrY n=1 Tax=Achromobacter veterisilvae TaxID=2069367 RepID=A0A446CS24_9BURK|nr:MULTISPECIES: response regulator transcription factor [Achromobacter]MCW0207854.1 response regulator transcription factor [Achromobacter sp.]SSW70666.1 Response regulator UvrY [Achromobacter veterisilvae]
MIRVLIVDDHTIFRDGLKRLLAEEDDISVTGETADASEALSLLRANSYDVVLLDVNLRGRSGLDVLPSIRAEWPRLPIIVLSMYPAEQYALRAFEVGASGYVAKDMDSKVLVLSIRQAAAGGRYFPAELSGKAASAIARGEVPHEKLSPREYQIMMLIVQGMRLTDIATQLIVSVKTISTYRQRILQKLKAGSNAELVQYVIRHGLID